MLLLLLSNLDDIVNSMDDSIGCQDVVVGQPCSRPHFICIRNNLRIRMVMVMVMVISMLLMMMMKMVMVMVMVMVMTMVMVMLPTALHLHTKHPGNKLASR